MTAARSFGIVGLAPEQLPPEPGIARATSKDCLHSHTTHLL